MESWTVRKGADIHKFESVQAILEVLEADEISIHHFRLMTAAAKVLLHHFLYRYKPRSAAPR
jgi:hypothetical protein